MKLYDFMHSPALCGAAFADPSWDTWRIIARLYDGDAALLTNEQQAIARKLIGREQLPTEAPRELFIGTGRRSGKTRFDSMLAVHAAAEDYLDATDIASRGNRCYGCHVVELYNAHRPKAR